MINFGGWDMPIHYGSQINEHLHTRNSTSIFDVSHMAVLDIKGSDSESFLKILLANNIDKLVHDGQALYSCMLNPFGGILDDLIVYKVGNFFRLVVNASTAEADLEWIKGIAKDFSDIEIIPRRSDLPGMQDPIVLIALQGPQCLNVISQVFPSISHNLSQIPYFGSKIFKTNFGEIMFST